MCPYGKLTVTVVWELVNVAGFDGKAIATPAFTYYVAGDKTLSHPLAGAPIDVSTPVPPTALGMGTNAP